MGSKAINSANNHLSMELSEIVSSSGSKQLFDTFSRVTGCDSVSRWVKYCFHHFNHRFWGGAWVVCTLMDRKTSKKLEKLDYTRDFSLQPLEATAPPNPRTIPLPLKAA